MSDAFYSKQVLLTQDMKVLIIAKVGAIHFIKQAIRDMCMKVAEHQATRSKRIPPVPSLPAAPAVKQEPTESYEPW